eukprot:scaffold93566_cov45-Cyclotella_meneghiniana.AAC.1
MYGGVLGEVFGFIILALSACYTYCVRRRIPFTAAANLNTGMTAVKVNGCIFIMAYVSVALTWGKSEDAPAYHTGIVYIVWSTAVPCNVVGDVCYFIVLHGVSIVEFVVVGNHAYISAWFIAVIDVNDQTNIVDENVEVTEDA